VHDGLAAGDVVDEVVLVDGGSEFAGFEELLATADLLALDEMLDHVAMVVLGALFLEIIIGVDVDNTETLLRQFSTVSRVADLNAESNNIYSVLMLCLSISAIRHLNLKPRFHHVVLENDLLVFDRHEVSVFIRLVHSV
jgi:hypothetical protein